MTEPRPFKIGDPVNHPTVKTTMTIIERSDAVTSSVCWVCRWYRTDMTEVRRAFLESTLRHARPEGGKGVA